MRMTIRCPVDTAFVSFTFWKILFVFLKVANFATPRELEISKYMMHAVHAIASKNTHTKKTATNVFERVR